LSVDLRKTCRIEAVRTTPSTSHRHGPRRRLTISAAGASLDGKTWETLVDKSANRNDVPHDYVQLPVPMNARHVRITNVYMPGGGPFSIRDLRLFGSGLSKPPAAAPKFEAHRDASDLRNAVVRWEILPDAEGSFAVRDCSRGSPLEIAPESHSSRSEHRGGILLRGRRVQRLGPTLGNRRCSTLPTVLQSARRLLVAVQRSAFRLGCTATEVPYVVGT
jgi:hypothetical protein